ncbi:OPT oligopeptide transporter protein-domain-containing protein [Choanephora cucurbitarum]|nr:OPT oligopeptide transporter protein-domain-containing protein [Choanephora cucurbitarum]
MYFGLQTGWISMMSLQASLLGFALFKSWHRHIQPSFGPKENVYLQTVAVATATMPLAAGFVGILPALSELTQEDHVDGPIVFSVPQLILWSLGLCLMGVFFAIPLRQQAIVREQLRFPSGTATAQMIELLHETKQDPQRDRIELMAYVDNDADSDDLVASIDRERTWALKLNALVISFSLSSLYTLASYFFPAIYALPVFNWLTLNWIDFKAWEWYFTPSLSYVGQGIIMGLPTTLSMLLGCVVGWGLLSPLAYFSGWAPGPIDDWKTGSKGWILWIALGIMIAESTISLLIVFSKQIYSMIYPSSSTLGEQQVESLEYEEDPISPEECSEDAPLHEQVPLSVTLIGLVISVILCIIAIQVVFGSQTMPIGMTCISIAFAFFLSILGVRALGETDLNPVSGIGKMSQVAFAALMPGAIVANLIAGGIAEAGAQQAGDLMQDLKTGYLLGASPRAQLIGQLIGSCISSVVATVAYLLYTTIYTIPGPEFPAPTAQVWLDMSRLVNGHPLPPHVSEFVWFFAFLFGSFVILKETRHVSYLPQGIAFAIGMYNPPSFTLARVIGGLLATLWDTYCHCSTDHWLDRWFLNYKDVGQVAIVIIASGFVLGEGTCAIVNMILHAFKVPHF